MSTSRIAIEEKARFENGSMGLLGTPPVLCSMAAANLRAVVLIAVLVSSAISAWAQSNAKQVYARAAPGVVLIKTDKGAGTGFLVSADGTIVTAFHGIDGATRITIKLQSGDIYDDVQMLAQDERRDIAVLKVNGFEMPTVALGNSNGMKPGDQIFVIGNPLGVDELKASISDGIVSGVRDLDDGLKTLQITAPISPGSSGSPVLNEEAEAVGIVVFRLKDGENLNFAIPINYVRGLLASNDKSRPMKEWKKTEGSSNLSFDKAAKSRWKSAKTGSINTLRFQGEYIYAEKEQPDDLRKLGFFYTFEVRKNGDKYSGTVHTNYIWWYTSSFTGEKVITNTCNVQWPIELVSVSSVRIEGRSLQPPEGAKLDKKKCTFSGSPAWREFVLIPE